MNIEDLRRDAKAVERTAWIEAIPDMGDLRLHVRGLGNAEYRRLQERLSDGVQRADRINGRPDPIARDRIVAQCLAETVLLGWENLTDAKGKPVPFSQEKGREFLMDPDFALFRDAVAWAAARVAEI